jgi:type IV secretion system protein TrbB
MLRTAMAPAITGWLEDPAIVEIMLSPDGRLWIDRLTGGLSDTGKRLIEMTRIEHLRRLPYGGFVR